MTRALTRGATFALAACASRRGLRLGRAGIEQPQRELLGFKKMELWTGQKRSPVRGGTGLLGFRLGGTVMGGGKTPIDVSDYTRPSRQTN